MKRKLSLLLVFVMLVFALTAPGVFAKQDIKVVFDNKLIVFDAQPIYEGGKILVPAKNIAEILGGKVRWDVKAREAWIDKDKMHIQVPIGSKTAYIHREDDFTGIPQAVKLDAAAKLHQGRVFVPLRFICDCFGLTVTWDNKTWTATLVSDNATIPVEKPLAFRVLSFADISSNSKLSDWYNANCRTQGFYSIEDSKATYILASAGQKPTGGYTLAIEAITLINPQTAYVAARLTTPSPGMIVTQALSFPSVLVRVEAANIKNVQGNMQISNDGSGPVKLPYAAIAYDNISGVPELAKWFEENRMIRGIHYLSFGKSVYVLVSAGEKPTGGYAVNVDGVTAKDADTAYVNASLTGPAKNINVIQILTYPCTLIRIDIAGIKDAEGIIK